MASKVSLGKSALDQLLTFISRVSPGIDSLPQDKMTANQALKHLTPRTSPDELRNTLPQLTSPDLDPNTKVTRDELREQFESNPFTLTPNRRSGKTGYQINDELNEPPPIDIDYADDGRSINVGNYELDAYRDSEHADDFLISRVESYIPMETISDRNRAASQLQAMIPPDVRTPEVMEELARIKIGEPPANPEVFSSILERVSDDHPLLSYRTWDTEGYNATTHDTLDTAHAQATQNLMRATNYADGTSGGGTRYETYTSPGPRTDYSETTTALNKPLGRAAGDTRRKQGEDYNERHWGTEEDNILFHTRQSTRPMYPDNTPVSMLEEAQSQWGQTGREKGFLPEPYLPNDIIPILDDVRAPRGPGAQHEQGRDMFGEGTGEYDFTDKRDPEYRRRVQDAERMADKELTAEELLEYSISPQQYSGRGTSPEAAAEDLRAYLNESGPRVRDAVPDMPYKNKTDQLALRQALAEAVSNDSPGLFIPHGREQVRRYENMGMSPANQEGLRKNYDEKLIATLNKMARPYKTHTRPGRINTSTEGAKGAIVTEGDAVPNRTDLGFSIGDPESVDVPDFSNLPKQHRPRDLTVTDELFGPVLRGKDNTILEEVGDIQRAHLNRIYSDPAKVEERMRGQVEGSRKQLLRDTVKNTQRGNYLEFTPELIEAVKKGIPLSLLAPLMMDSEE
mgnify:CR=1 FL=1